MAKTSFCPLGGHTNIWEVDEESKSLVKWTSPIEASFYWFVYLTSGSGNLAASSDQSALLANSITRALSPHAWRRQASVTIPASLRPLLPYIPQALAVRVSCDYNKLPQRYAVHMRNLLNDPNAPYCAMDLKIGTCLYGLDADSTKRQRMEKKALVTTAATTGLCLIAYRCTLPSDPLRVAFSLDRASAREILEAATLQQELMRFFSLASTRSIEDLQRKVGHLIAWFSWQKICHFRSSSLLVVYDARNVAPIQLKLIDFAHASFFHRDIDSSSLRGLQTFDKILKEMLSQRESSARVAPEGMAIAHGSPRRPSLSLLT